MSAAAESPTREWWVSEKGLPHARREPHVDHLGTRLLLVTDLDDASHHAEVRAIGLAQQAGARLRVVATPAPEARQRGTAVRNLRRLIRLARDRGVDAVGMLVTGDPADAILHGAQAFHADALIIVHDPRCGSTPGAGGCGHVILHAPCPVLLVPTTTAA